MKITDDVYLVKLKAAGVPHQAIATRMGLSLAEVEKRWTRIEADLVASQTNGYGSLCDQFTVMAHQYQLLGESLKVIGGALGHVVSSEELAKAITKDPHETLAKLKDSFIILHPFVPVNLEEAIKKTTEGN